MLYLSNTQGQTTISMLCAFQHPSCKSLEHVYNPLHQSSVMFPQMHKQTLSAGYILLKSIKQLFMGLLFISSTPSRTRIKELLLVLALVCSLWGLWRPGRALSEGEGLALAAPWSWSSVWLTCRIPTPCNIFCFSCSCFSSWILELRPTTVSTILPRQFYLSFLMWLCSTDRFTAFLHNFTISSAASAKVMQLGHTRPELNHGEGGSVTEGATEQVGYSYPAVPYQNGPDLGPETLNLFSLSWNRSHYSSLSPTNDFPPRPPNDISGNLVPWNRQQNPFLSVMLKNH